MRKQSLIILNLLQLTSLASSQLYNNNENIDEIISQNMYEPNYFNLFFGLFTVITLIYISAFVYKKLSSVKIAEVKNNINKIEIISTASVGQGRNLHIIKVNNEYLLIGATQNSITHIKDYPQEYINAIKKECDEQDN